MKGRASFHWEPLLEVGCLGADQARQGYHSKQEARAPVVERFDRIAAPPLTPSRLSQLVQGWHFEALSLEHTNVAISSSGLCGTERPIWSKFVPHCFILPATQSSHHGRLLMSDFPASCIADLRPDIPFVPEHQVLPETRLRLPRIGAHVFGMHTCL